MCRSRTAGTRRTLTLRSQGGRFSLSTGFGLTPSSHPQQPVPKARAFFLAPGPRSPVSVQSSRQVIGHEHGAQLAQTERARGGAQRWAVQEDARARRGGRGGRSIVRHRAEHALEDSGPLQLELQARGRPRAAQNRGHAWALQAGHRMEHTLGHLQEDRRVSGPRRSKLLMAAVPGPAHLSVLEARL